MSIGLAIGAVAGLLEVAMVRTYEKSRFMLAAILVYWMGFGGVVPFLKFDERFWVNALFLGLLTGTPFIILAAQKSRNATIHTSLFLPIWSLVIGFLVSLLAVVA